MNNKKRITTVDLLRHGEPAGGRRIRGSTDDPLTERGWKQMRAVGAGTAGWDAVISSPLVRCSSFARELARMHSLPLHVDKRLQEMHFGLWEGRHPLQLLAREVRGIAQFVNDPARFAPPGAEAIGDFQSRVADAWAEHLSRYAGRHLLVISHGGTIRMILGLTFQMSVRTLLRLKLPHASVTRIQVVIDEQGQVEPTLLFHGRRYGTQAGWWRRLTSAAETCLS